MPKCTYSRTTDYGHTMLNPQFFAAQIQIPAPNKYLGFGHEDLVCRNNGLFIEHEQGTHSTKMVGDTPAENTPKASKNFSPKI